MNNHVQRARTQRYANDAPAAASTDSSVAVAVGTPCSSSIDSTSVAGAPVTTASRTGFIIPLIFCYRCFSSVPALLVLAPLLR